MAAGWMNWTMQSRKAKVHPPGRLMGVVPIPDMQRSMRNWVLQSRKAKARAPVHASWAGERVWRVCLPVKKNGSGRQKQSRSILFAATEFRRGWLNQKIF
jgi:hypothetical protein